VSTQLSASSAARDAANAAAKACRDVLIESQNEEFGTDLYQGLGVKLRSTPSSNSNMAG